MESMTINAMDCFITELFIEDGNDVYHVSRVIPDFKVLTGDANVTTTFSYPASTNTRTLVINSTTKFFSVRGQGLSKANIKITLVTLLILIGDLERLDMI